MTAKILCIEDEADIRQVVVEELTDEGYETIEAANGQLGLEAILRQKPDLVLCDVNMPVMDGHALLAELRSNYPEKADLPFIFLTALSDRQHILTGKKLGVDDYLTKPIDFELLIATVEARLKQVSRMTARKDEQMVKLYKSLHHDSADDHGGDDGGDGGSAAYDIRATLAQQSRDRGGSVVAGRLQMIGLERVKKQLGADWPRYAKRILDIANKIISNHLTPQDVVQKQGNAGFVICFAELSEEEASFKASAIARKIQEKVLGSEEGAAVDVEMAPETLTESMEVKTDAVTMEVAPAAFEGKQTLATVADVISEKIKEARSRIQENIPALMREITEKFDISIADVIRPDDRKAQFVLAQPDGPSQARIGRIMGAVTETEGLARDLDMIALGRVTEHLCQSIGKTPMVVFAGVSFRTLVAPKFRKVFLSTCHELPGLIRPQLGFMIEDIPDRVHEGQIVDLTRHLAPYSRTQMIRLSPAQIMRMDFSKIGSALVATPYTSMLSFLVAKKSAGLKRMNDKLREMRLVVTDVPNAAKLALLRRLRINAYTMNPDPTAARR